MGLTFVPTPLGNLRDITLRALDVLKASDLIVAEDTRVTRRLLAAYGIEGKRLWSYREQNAAGATPGILEAASSGNVAVVSDAGMPGISDPGRELVAAARAAGVAVEVLPGASAFVCAAVLSGFDLSGMTFGGFLPRASSARRTALQSALASGVISVWYESPARIVATLQALDRLAPDIDIFVGRELTKFHEQQIDGTPRRVLEQLEEPVRGEIVLVIGPFTNDAPSALPATTESNEELDTAILRALETGLSVAETAKRLARARRLSRELVYSRAVSLKAARPNPT